MWKLCAPSIGANSVKNYRTKDVFYIPATATYDKDMESDPHVKEECLYLAMTVWTPKSSWSSERSLAAALLKGGRAEYVH